MSWSRAFHCLNTVRFRLTLGYAVLFVAVAVILLASESTLLRRHFAEARDEALLAELRELKALHGEFGMAEFSEELRRAGEAKGTQNVVLIFRGPDGVPVATSDLKAWGGVSFDDPVLPSLEPGEVRFRTLYVPDSSLVLRLAASRLPDDCFLQVGLLATDPPMVGRYRSLFPVVLAGMLVVGVGLGWVLIGRAMGGVHAVATTADAIGRGDLSKRVPHAGRGREIDELVDAFNGMLDRIDAVVVELREVTENIAHDLRSPLTRIRGLMETVDEGGESLPAYRAARSDVIEECDRLVQMVNTMLDIAEANAGLRQTAESTLDLRDVAAEIHDLFLPAAEEAGIAFSLDLPRESMIVRADRRAVLRILSNLIDNSLKHTPAGGDVRLVLERGKRMATILVSDSGAGIPAEDLPHVFERFFRSERSRSTAGHGLGLSLVRALANSLGGEVSVESVVDEGTDVTVSLPIADNK